MNGIGKTMSDLKFNDTVISRLLNGKWKVLKVLPGGRTEVCQDGHMLRVDTHALTVLPPEPEKSLVEAVAEELAYQFLCGGAPKEDYMDAAEAVVRVVDDWRANP
jgi:hypothetical protein